MHNIDYYDLATQLGIRGGVSAAGQMYAQCPFHADRSPSFSMNVRDGLWFCHTEQRGGAFDEVVAHVQGVSRTAAMMWIIANARASGSQTEQVGETSLVQERIDAQQAYYSRLDETLMCQWWFDRGFTWDDAAYWSVRYDQTSNEVIFPIVFPSRPEGQWIGYIRRTFGGTAKYINSPGIPRRNLLYGYGAERGGAAILLCEGPTDAIAARRAGYHAMSALGVYVTDVQLRLFSQVPAQRYVLAFDNDDPGRDAIMNIIQRWTLGGLYVFDYQEGTNDVGECNDGQVRAGVEGAIPASIYSTRRVSR